jgi:glycosyltransferase involved in cell wall biosynthesis
MARRKKVPHVIGPCGLLGPIALQRSKWKKEIVRFLFQDRALHDADCLLANSEEEYHDIRAFGLENPVAVIPNPVPGPDGIENPVTATDFLEKFSLRSDKKRLVFLGRIHPTKGVRRLTKVWSVLLEFHEQWDLVIAGPDEAGYRSLVEDDIKKAGCTDSITFTGSLDDRWKWGMLSSANLFVMPSKYENFGIAIVESLLAGVPVVTTTGTPWKSLVEHNAGWHVNPEIDTLVKALKEAMSLNDRDRQKMGRNGQLLGRRFLPDVIALELIALYEWLLGRTERPSFVRMT